jgi:MFS family permease
MRLQPFPMRRNRDFMLLWSGESVSQVGSAMSTLVFPLVGYALTRSTVQAGIATTAFLVGGLGARLPAGALVDRWPRDRVLLAVYLAGALAYGSLAAAALAGVLTLAQLVLIGFLTGVLEAFAAPATSAAVRSIVPAPELPAAYSQLQAQDHAAQLIGPPVGGALYSVARGLPFLADGVSYLIGAACVARVRAPLPPPPRQNRPLRHDVAEGLQFAWRQVAIRVTMTWGSLFNFAMTYVFIAITLRLVRAGVHPAAIGTISTIAAAAGLAGAVVAPTVLPRVRTGVLTVTTGLALACIVAPMAWTTNVVVIGVLYAVGFFLVPANNAGISAYFVSVVPDRLQGRVNSAAGFMANCLSPLAPVVAGWGLAAFGGRGATLAGAGLVAASLVPVLASRTTRSLGRPAAWTVAQVPDVMPTAER